VGWFLVLIKKSANNSSLKLLKFPKMKLYKLFCKNQIVPNSKHKISSIDFQRCHRAKPFWMFVKPKSGHQICEEKMG